MKIFKLKCYLILLLLFILSACQKYHFNKSYSLFNYENIDNNYLAQIGQLKELGYNSKIIFNDDNTGKLELYDHIYSFIYDKKYLTIDDYKIHYEINDNELLLIYEDIIITFIED